MAENINIPISDGQNFQAPLWATQATLEAVLNAVDQMAGTSEETKKLFKQVAKSTANGETNDDEITDAIEKLNDNQEETVTAIKESSGRLKEYGSAVYNLAKGIATGFAIIGMGFFKLAHEIGKDTAKMDGGLALDTSLNAVNFANSIRMLGISNDDLRAKLENSAASIAIMGRESYVSMSREIIDITNSGIDFAKSLSEITDILDEDLKLRQQIGVLNKLDQGKTAKMSRELYEKQLKDQLLLGKTIGAMRDAANDPMQDIAVQLNAARMGGASDEFVNALQSMAGEMIASGATQGLINATSHAANEIVAFSTKAGTDLFSALTVIDSKLGTDMRSAIKEIQQADPSDVPALLRALPGHMRNAVTGVSEDKYKAELQGLRALQAGMNNPLMDELMASMVQMRQIDAARSDPKEIAFNKLAKAATAYQNALDIFSGSLKGMNRNFVGAFSLPLTALMEGLTKDMGATFNEHGEHVSGSMNVFESFTQAIMKISNAFTGLFGITDKGTSKFDELSKLLASKINPIIEKWSNTIVAWIESLNQEKIDGYIDSMVNAFTVVYQIARGLAKAFAWIADFLIVTESVEKTTQKRDDNGRLVYLDENGQETLKSKGAEDKNNQRVMETVYKVDATTGKALKDIDGNRIAEMEEKFNPWQSLAKALATAFAVQAVFFAATALFSGAATWAFAKIFSGAAATAALGSAGAGLSALSVGLTALSTAIPVILTLTAAIIGIGVALWLAAPAVEAIGKVIMYLFEGMATLVEAVGTGIGTIITAIGSLWDTSAENIAEQNAQTDNVKKLSEIDPARLLATSVGVTAIADALEAFGDATNDGFLSGPDISDTSKMVDLMTKLSTINGTGLLAFTDGMKELIRTIQDLNRMDTALIMERADALGHLNKVTSRSFASRVMDTVSNAFNGSRNDPAIVTAHVSRYQPTEQAGADALAMIPKDHPLETVMIEIAKNTQKTQSKLTKLLEKT